MNRLPTPAALAEVVVTLGGTILDVRHVGRDAASSPWTSWSSWSPWLARYTLGEGPRVQLPVALPGCDEAGSFTLVEASAAGIVLRLAPTMTGELVCESRRERIEDLLARAETTRVMQPGEHARVQLGALELTIRVEAATPVQSFRAQIDRPLWLTQAGALALFAVLMIVVQRSEPASEAARFDDPDIQATLIRYFNPATRRRPRPPRRPRRRAHDPRLRSPRPRPRPLRPPAKSRSPRPRPRPRPRPPGAAPRSSPATPASSASPTSCARSRRPRSPPASRWRATSPAPVTPPRGSPPPRPTRCAA